MSARLGFGTHRVRDDVPEHHAALVYALEHGVDLIDTSAMFSDGSSENAVGAACTAAHAEPRIITKVAPDPAQLEDAVHASLARMERRSVDSVLLDLSGRGTTEIDLVGCFRALEHLRAVGQCTTYGIHSASFLRDPADPAHLSLTACIAAATEAGGSSHGFASVETPFNVLENTAALVPTQHDGTPSLLEHAMECGIGVIASRPLDAVVNQELIRLVTYDAPHKEPDAEAIETRIHTLEITEHEILQELIVLATPGERERAAMEDAWRVAGLLCTTWRSFTGKPHWNDVRTRILDPRLEVIARSVARFAPSAHRISQYVRDMDALLREIDARYAWDENHSLNELRLILADEFGCAPDATLQHIALQAVRSTPGITAVVVGMRRPAYVDDALAVWATPATPVHHATWMRVHQHLERLSS
jgi:hypothetical protein